MLAVMLCRWSSQLLECEMRLSARVFRLAPTTFLYEQRHGRHDRRRDDEGHSRRFLIGVGDIGEKTAQGDGNDGARCTIEASVYVREEERHERASRRQSASALVGPPAL